MTAPPEDSTDKLADRALTALRSAVAATGSKTMSILVDPTLSDALIVEPCVQEALTSGHVTHVRLPRIHDDIDPEAAPYLLHVADEFAAERVVNISIAIAAFEANQGASKEAPGRSVCAWIIGEENPRATAIRLADAARIVRPDGSPWYLRYWDPRVMWHLPRVLPQAQWSELQVQLGQWWALDQLNQFVPRTSPTVAHKNTGTGADTSPPVMFQRLRIDAPVWTRLSLIGVTNTVLEMAWEWGVIPTAANAQRIESMLRRCRALGFETAQDELVFCSCALTSRDDFDSHPTVNQALVAAANRKASVAEALAAFDDAFWAGMSPMRPAQQT